MRLLVLPGVGHADARAATLASLAQGLSAHGHQVVTVEDGLGGTHAWEGCDAALATADLAARAAARARAHGKPLAAFVNGEHDADLCRGLVDLAVLPSETLRRQLRWRHRTVVVPPPVRVDDYRTCRYAVPGCPCTRGGACTSSDVRIPGAHASAVLLNLSTSRGAGFFYDLARRLPGIHFLGVKPLDGELAFLAPRGVPNVEVIDRQPDVRQVYARAKVLLLPADESYGRAALEAACSGIPTVAHPSPGLRESIGDAAVYAQRERPLDWTHELSVLFKSRGRYEFQARSARARVWSLDPDASVVRLEDALLSLVAVAA